MQAGSMEPREREALWATLAGMPDFLEQAFENLPPGSTTVPGPEGSFSPVEQC
jgi:hypothetical protein